MSYPLTTVSSADQHVVPGLLLLSLTHNVPVGITYTDADGVTSTRNVTVKTIQRSNHTNEVYVIAFDNHRKAYRTFALDRINAAAIHATDDSTNAEARAKEALNV